MTTPISRWRRTTVGSELQIKYGKSLPVEERSPDGRYPVVGSAGVMTYTSSLLAPDSTVIIGRKGNVGSIHLECVGSWPIDTTFYAAVPPGLDARFLKYQLTFANLSRLDSSTATPSLRRQDLEAQELVLPTRDDQLRIVDILEEHLSRLDASMTSLSVSAQRLDHYADQVIRAALIGRTVPGSRETATLPTSEADDGALEALPSGWYWRRLGEIADVAGGITKDSKKQSNLDLVEVPYLRVANVQRGRLDLRVVSTIRTTRSKIAALRLRHGDVLLNEGGDRDKLARGWVWESQMETCIHQNHVFRARIRDEIIDPRILSWAANTLGGPWAEKNGKQTTNLASISMSRIRLLPIPVPPREHQGVLVQRIDSTLREVTILNNALRTAKLRSETLRRAILAAAFSGRLTGHARDMDQIEELAGV